MSKKEAKYQELKKRIEREKQLNIVSQKMERKKHLMVGVLSSKSLITNKVDMVNPMVGAFLRSPPKSPYPGSTQETNSRKFQ